jgi:cystathionine beta-lyase/cystathionine gamma-synthase
MIERIFNSEYMNIGSGIQPFNAWLLIRGLRTLPVRLERITKTTYTIVEYLAQHPKVEKLYFPFSPGFPQLELAKKQMKDACGLLSFVITASTVEQVEAFCEALKHFFMAVSWGGHESLIIPRCAGMKREDFDSRNPEHRMIRMYVGLEDADYLVRDLDTAFAAMD